MAEPTEKMQQAAADTLRIQLYSYLELEAALNSEDEERIRPLAGSRRAVQQMATDSEIYGDDVATAFMLGDAFLSFLPDDFETAPACEIEPAGWGK